MSYFDNKGLKQQHYCAPINLNKKHWVTIDVTLPTDKLTNGRLMITDHVHIYEADIDTTSKLLYTYYSQMWWVNYFRIYNKNKCVVPMHNIYFSSHDLHISPFILKDKENSFQCSTPDHC